MRASPRQASRRSARRLGRRPWLATLIALALPLAAGCASSSSGPPGTPGGSAARPTASATAPASPIPAESASSSPATSPAASSCWSVANIEQPVEVGVAPSGAAPGLFCSPCHSAVTTYVTGIAAGGPGLVAVGLVFNGAYANAAAWTSSDGLDWTQTPAMGADGTAAFAIANGPAGLVAVGDAGPAPAAWRSTDGSTWRAATMPAVAAHGAAQLLAVSGSPSGYLGGGWLLGPDGRSSATIWTSSDGRVWATDAALPGGAGAQVHGLAAHAALAVAVGVSTAGSTDRAVAWASSDGHDWRPASVDGADGSRMEAVVATPAGWLAVGSRDGSLSAAAWTSTDGLTWHAAPEEPALRNLGGDIHMLGVAPDGAGYVAVGWRDSAGNGNAVAWTSADGAAWTRMTDDDSFSGGGMAGVTVQGGRVVAIGTVGWPDDHFATIWVHPAPGG